MCMSLHRVERVSTTLPQEHVALMDSYLGWISFCMGNNLRVMAPPLDLLPSTAPIRDLLMISFQISQPKTDRP
jgi:hypothetical protein